MYVVTRENGEEWELEIDFDYSPGEKGVHTLSNGDPGWPEVPSDVDINSICLDGVDVQDLLTDKDIEDIIQQCFDSVEGDNDPGFEPDERDYRC